MASAREEKKLGDAQNDCRIIIEIIWSKIEFLLLSVRFVELSFTFPLSLSLSRNLGKIIDVPSVHDNTRAIYESHLLFSAANG